MCPLALSLFIYSINLACVYSYDVSICVKIYTPNMTHELAAESVFSVVVSFARKNELERVRILQRDDFFKG
jgi:hypothetical protein